VLKPFWVRSGTGWSWARLSFDQHELVMGDKRHSLRAGRNRVHEVRVSRSGWVKVRFCDGVAPKLRFRGQHPAKITWALRERGWPVVEEADPSGSPEPNRR